MTDNILFTLPEEARPEYAETHIVPVNDDGSLHLERIRFRAFNDGVSVPHFGKSWTLQTSPWDGVGGAFDGQSVWSETLGLFIITSDSDQPTQTVITSPDGINWTSHDTELYVAGWYGHLPLNDAAPLLITDLSGIANPNAYSSSDGINWSQLTTPSDINIDSAAWSPELGLWAAVSFQAEILTSPDGTTWTQRTTPTEFSTGLLNSVCWSSDLGLFCAVGKSDGPPYYSAAISSDGITWTAISAGFPGEGLVFVYDVTWSSALGMFMFACSGNSTGISTSPSIIYSSDGTSWSWPANGKPHSGESLCILEAFGTVFAGGYRAPFGGGAVMTSTDLTTWTDSMCPLDGQVSSFAYSPSLDILIAVGFSDPSNGAIATYS